MSQAPEVVHCCANGGREAPLSHVDPYFALRYHFGMLLGVEDFETEQAYHRGKMRLHNAWLHRAGVVWGFGVSWDRASGEIRVAAGLGLDAVGHELHLEGPWCISVPAWYDRHRQEAAVIDVVEPVPESSAVDLDVWVALRFRACLTREVPALSEPCEGAKTDTAFSRVVETVELSLEPGTAPPRSLNYHRLRLLFQLEAARLDDNLAVLGADQEVLDRRDQISALPAEQQPAAYLAALRYFAALDVIDMSPAREADGAHDTLFPEIEPAPLVLAQLRLRIEPRDTSWALTDADVDQTVRSTLLPTSDIEELLCGPLFSALSASSAGGPRVASAAITDSETLTLTLDAPLQEGTVAPDAFKITSRPEGQPAALWTKHTVTDADFATDSGVHTVVLKVDTSAPSAMLPAAKARIRVLACGTGPTPLLGLDNKALAGAVGGPAADDDGGRDYVHTIVLP